MARTAAPGCRGQVGRTLGRERLWVAGYNNPYWNRTRHFGYDGYTRIETVERVVCAACGVEPAVLRHRRRHGNEPRRIAIAPAKALTT